MYQRNTIQRQAILETVKQLKNHPTADEVYAEIAKRYPSISRSTVYRGLNELSEAGELKKVEIPGGADHYDHHCAEHYHVRCLICGKVTDVGAEVRPDWLDSVKGAQGYRLTGLDIVFRGVCPNCQKNEIKKLEVSIK